MSDDTYGTFDPKKASKVIIDMKVKMEELNIKLLLHSKNLNNWQFRLFVSLRLILIPREHVLILHKKLINKI